MVGHLGFPDSGILHSPFSAHVHRVPECLKHVQKGTSLWLILFPTDFGQFAMMVANFLLSAMFFIVMIGVVHKGVYKVHDIVPLKLAYVPYWLVVTAVNYAAFALASRAYRIIKIGEVE